MATATSLAQTVAPASEPVSVAECRDHLEIGSGVTDHDAKFAIWIEAARRQYEHDTGLALISQTWTLQADAWPDDLLQIPLRPVASVSSVTYYDENDTQQTLATTVYGFDSARRAIYLKVDQSCPLIFGQL